MADAPDDGVVVGIDGGGTKTDVLVLGVDATVLGRAAGGGANWEGIGVEAVGAVLDELLGHALDRAGAGRDDVLAWACCLAGVDWPSDPARLDPVLDALGVGGARLLSNDAFAALRAGTSGGVGCVSIAGTGGVCAGRDRSGRTARTMGVGMGEGSGAWSLVGRALDAVAAAHHHSGPPTELSDRFTAAAGVGDVPALFEGVTRGSVHVGADLAVAVLAAAADGDPVAVQVATAVGDQHGRDLAGLADRLGLTDEPLEVVTAGGVHVHGDGAFRDAFRAAVLDRVPAAGFHPLEAPPVVGAALLALEAAGLPGEPVRADLLRVVGSGS